MNDKFLLGLGDDTRATKYSFLIILLLTFVVMISQKPAI